MKSLKNFEANQINCSNVHGGALIPIATGEGIVQGMHYDSDEFYDSNHDGTWGSGETIRFHYHKIQHEGMG